MVCEIEGYWCMATTRHTWATLWAICLCLSFLMTIDRLVRRVTISVPNLRLQIARWRVDLGCLGQSAFCWHTANLGVIDVPDSIVKSRVADQELSKPVRRLSNLHMYVMSLVRNLTSYDCAITVSDCCWMNRVASFVRLMIASRCQVARRSSISAWVLLRHSTLMLLANEKRCVAKT